jgi:uncharacterized membrane protein YeaQ/YmgE (transglycosylase-associated protein family)
MTKKMLLTTLGIVFGLVFGAIIGGYLGLVVGGTFLGGFDIYEKTGFQGYELSLYVGAVIGAFVMVKFGIKIALGIFERGNK